MQKSVFISVYGRVQGVGFRFHTHKKALELGIKGFVRNKPDGSVYIEAEGQSKDVDEFVDWCRLGPEWARVDRLEKQFGNLLGYDKFEIK